MKGALGFVTGFTVVFMMLGALAGTVGSFLREYQTAVDIVSGLIVVFFGLNFLGVFKLNLFRGGSKSVKSDNMGFFSAFLFGMVFSIGWTPCVGAFLGSALMLASQQAHILEGMMMLLAYSLGLGIPFVLSAVLIDYNLKSGSISTLSGLEAGLRCNCSQAALPASGGHSVVDGGVVVGDRHGLQAGLELAA